MKYILMYITLFLVFPSYPQKLNKSIGLQGGYGLSDLRGNFPLAPRRTFEPASDDVAYYGVTFSINISNRFDLSTGYFYEELKSQVVMPVSFNQMMTINDYINFRYLNYTIPLDLKFKVLKELDLYMGTGVFISFIQEKTVHVSTPLVSSNVLYDDTPFNHRMNFGYNLLIGYNFPISENFSFNVEIRNQRGLRNLRRNDYEFDIRQHAIWNAYKDEFKIRTNLTTTLIGLHFHF